MLHNVRKYDGETTGKHIVMLKPDVSKAELLAKLSTMNADITHDWDFINSFAGASESCRLSSTDYDIHSD
jgi:cerevisin